MNYSLGKWNHPTTGELRLYVNSDRLRMLGHKVWLVASNDALGSYEIKCSGGICRDEAETEVDWALNEAGVKPATGSIRKFADVVAVL